MFTILNRASLQPTHIVMPSSIGHDASTAYFKTQYDHRQFPTQS